VVVVFFCVAQYWLCFGLLFGFWLVLYCCWVVGGTCVFGTQNFYVGDVDSDGVMEIITGGFSYKAEEGARISASQAPLKVWSWNGQNITLEASRTWPGLITSIYGADLDKDGVLEIITAGAFYNETGSYSSLKIWHLSDRELTLQASKEGTRISALFAADADQDGEQEILTVGRSYPDTGNTTQLVLWSYQENNLSIDSTSSLEGANITSANSLFASDFDNDGSIEVAIGGYSGDLSDSKGQLTIWHWNRTAFHLVSNENWQILEGTAETIAGGIMGNTVVNNIKAADLNGDGTQEVVTAGFTYNGKDVSGQIKVWKWNGSALSEIADQVWVTDYLTEAKSLTLNDVDGDGQAEIVQSGIAAAAGSFNNTEAAHDRAQLRVWSLSGGVLILEHEKDWTFDDGACAWNVGSGDVDNDGIVEMITIGCSAYGGLCDPDMRIWSISSANAYYSYLPYLAGAVLIAVVIGAFSFLMVRKKRAANRVV